MRFAMIDNERVLATPGAEALCPVCAAKVIARCGALRVHHWAHRGARRCDTWWEPETEWHRDWKMLFDASWQECVAFDELGEKHIADVKTPSGVVFEFQHSHLAGDERSERERFHQELIWVVDGLRLQRDLPRFAAGVRDLRPFLAPKLFTHPFPDELVSKAWLGAGAPVFLDFGSASPAPGQDAPDDALWALLPQATRVATFVRMPRSVFIQTAREAPERLLFGPLRQRIDEIGALQRRKDEGDRLRQVAALMQRQRRFRRRLPRRF